jgi:hypothetical protein
MVKDIKKNLTNIVVIIGLVGSIGAGFSKFAKMENTIEQLSSQTTVDYSSQIAVLEEKVTALENRKSVDISGVTTRSKINEKEIKLLQLQINEIKVLNSNPLQ